MVYFLCIRHCTLSALNVVSYNTQAHNEKVCSGVLREVGRYSKPALFSNVTYARLLLLKNGLLQTEKSPYQSLLIILVLGCDELSELNGTDLSALVGNKLKAFVQGLMAAADSMIDDLPNGGPMNAKKIRYNGLRILNVENNFVR